MRRRYALFLALVTGGAVLAQASPALAAPATDQEVPFPCRQEWYGSSRSGHSPSYWSVDWNRTDDVNDPVVASAAGVVSRVEDLGGRSYGRYVVVDHGNGESTVYAHLAAEYVTLGQRLDQGELIGLLGTSGNSTGPHLHYEQRLDGRDQQAWFHDEAFTMPATVTSRNCVDTPVAGDWNGDGVAQIGFYRRGATPSFRLAWGAEVRTVAFGGPTDTPLVGDWDGDGVSDQGVRVGGSSTYVLRTGDGATTTLQYGYASDRAVAGDWDGDWNGDGRTDVGVWSSGGWTLQVLRARRPGWTGTVRLGGTADLPVVGDWNGDGATDLGTWSPSTALFTLRKTAPRSLDAGEQVTRTWGRVR